MNGAAICVFCGSRHGSNPAYSSLAEQTGRALAQRGGRLVYGGGALGLMGVVSDSVLAAGGHATGVIPDFLRYAERQHDRLSRLIITHDMFERKQTMFDLSDGFLALPGGIGTLDEVLEVMTWKQLGRFDKPLVFLDVNDFWTPFLAAIDQAIGQEFAGDGIRSLYRVESTVEDALAALGLPEL